MLLCEKLLHVHQRLHASWLKSASGSGLSVDTWAHGVLTSTRKRPRYCQCADRPLNYFMNLKPLMAHPIQCRLMG